jgi:hypothetical protein
VKTFTRGSRLTDEFIQEYDRLLDRLQELEAENAGLRARVAADRAVRDLVTKIEKLETEKRDLLSRTSRAEAITNQFTARVQEVETEFSNLANLYVASYQLHGTLDRARVLDAIKEIVINLIGSEELVIWERAGNMLHVAASFGMSAEEWNYIRVGEGLVGLCVETGKRFIAREWLLQVEERERGLTACIPLMLDERVIGAIGLFKLLPQKSDLEPIDFELFDLLASHAASALYCTRFTLASGEES